MLKLKLPFWNDKGSSKKLLESAQLYWDRTADALRWPLTQVDPEHCTVGVLNLIAWQRDVTRFTGEPLWLYRLRVKHAYANALDAGSVIGTNRIFQRLGIGYVELEERSPERDWDVIILRLSDSQLSDNTDLLRVLMEKYGRTCRRYEFQVVTNMVITTNTVDFNNVWHTDVARF